MAPRVVAGVKAPTIGGCDDRRGRRRCAMCWTAARTTAAKVDVVMIGTTHFTNAVVQRRDLAQTAAVRLCLPATASLPPMVRLARRSARRYRQPLVSGPWRQRIRRPRDFAARRGRTAGHRRRHPLQGHQVHRHHLGLFAGLDPSSKSRPARSWPRRCPMPTSPCPSDIGRIGLLERENAAIMNACLRDLSRACGRGASARRWPMSGSPGRFYLTQNDGTLMDADLCRTLPGPDLRLRPHQLDARRRLPVGRGRCHRGRYRRHDLGRRFPAEGLPPSGHRRGRGGRRPHQLPHAGRLLHRPWRRLSRRGRPGRGDSRPSFCRLPDRDRGAVCSAARP